MVRTRSVRGATPSTAPAGLRVRLNQLRDHLPPTAARIAGFLADHGEDAIRMSITEVAERTAAAEGSVVSLCRRLGLSGFQELKILLARDLVAPVQLIQEDLREGDPPETVADRVFAAHVASLDQTRRLLSPAELARAVDALRAAARLEVYGIGSSAPVAQDLAYRLMQLGLVANAVVDSHVQAVAAAMTGPGVAVVTISHSGSTRETVAATRLAQAAGARTIGVTRVGTSPLGRYCDIMLHTVANETQYRPEAMSSRVAQLAIVDTLVSCCAIADPARTIPNLRRSAQVIAGKRY